MKEAIDLAVKGGYMAEGAVEFARSSDGRMTKDGHATLNGWSVWNLPSGSLFIVGHHETLLDPKFWQALGKAMGWKCSKCGGDGYTSEHDLPSRHGEDGECVSCPIKVQCDCEIVWRDNWHRFIDHLAEGKDADSFFTNLLK